MQAIRSELESENVWVVLSRIELLLILGRIHEEVGDLLYY
jgi:hypothetical protein